MNGFLGAGAGIAIFDSFIAPPMLSPQNYEEIVLPFHQELFAMLREKGISLRALIVGGNTLPILPNLVKSGANQFILDYNIPIENVREVMTQYPEMLFRINLPPSLIMAEDMIAIANFVHKTLEIIGDKRNLILGTGDYRHGHPKNISFRSSQQCVIFMDRRIELKLMFCRIKAFMINKIGQINYIIRTLRKEDTL